MIKAVSSVQRAILQAAAIRNDRLLDTPNNLRGGVTKQIGAKFLAAGWAKEIKATKDAPVWRRDAMAGHAFALKLTPVGMKAVAAFPEASEAEVTATTSAAIGPKAEIALLVGPDNKVVTTEPTSNIETADGPRAPRSGSKLDRVQQMQKAEDGATPEEITAVTRWLPHSARAALTGLRKRGYRLTLSRGERNGVSVYRTPDPVDGPSA